MAHLSVQVISSHMQRLQKKLLSWGTPTQLASLDKVESWKGYFPSYHRRHPTKWSSSDRPHTVVWLCVIGKKWHLINKAVLTQSKIPSPKKYPSWDKKFLTLQHRPRREKRAKNSIRFFVDAYFKCLYVEPSNGVSGTLRFAEGTFPWLAISIDQKLYAGEFYS